MKRFKLTVILNSVKQLGLTAMLGLMALLMMSSPAFAHHPLDGRLPANIFEGLFSGIAHPVIGFDHLAFVIAAGLVGALIKRGMVIPIAFVAASLGGTGLHLLLMDLPAPELVISASVLMFGVVLAWGRSLNLNVVTALGAIAGLFHGYAYGEAVVGAQMTPLFAYLIGFTGIQLAVSLSAWKFGQIWMNRNATKGLLRLRFIGFTVCGLGAAFLSGVVLG
ncbi:MAG: HupE/UreJ family protein [Cyanobacteria bacterium J06627_28]